MRKVINNNKGVALLIVMVLMTVTFTIAYMALYISSRGGIMAYEYGNGIRALNIAEAGADLVISEWSNYIHTLKATNTLSDPLYMDDFRVRTSLDSKVANLQEDFIINYNNTDISISLVNYSANAISPPNYVVIDIEGRYGKDTYNCKVKLTYDMNGVISYFKEF